MIKTNTSFMRRDALRHLGGLALIAGAAGRALAQGATSKPIRIISAYGAGLGPDGTVRMLAEKLSSQTGQPVVVDARPGGNGLVAINALKQAPADGYTLLFVSNAHLTINPHLFSSPTYKVDAFLEPVSTTYRAPFYIAVAAGSPFRSLAQMVAQAKADPGRLMYSVPYIGSPPHLGGALLEHLTGTKMLAIPYKDAQLMTSVMTGEVDFTIGTLGSLAPLVKGGKLRLLAIAQPTRSRVEPDVPTAEESGGPKELVVQSWVGLVALKGAPADVLRRVNEEVRRALASPEITERYVAAGYSPAGSTPAEFAQLIKQDDKFYADLIKRIGMKTE
ncbi:MAG: tripartite tricarboxylate transporter substrate binding protein [Comamonadaceae bacterium]|nr:MAG: tripartite tricarboxylate transporter substrate binding protein [Comamonadaceae bacterium]